MAWLKTPPLRQTDKREKKKGSKPPWQPLTPRENLCKKNAPNHPSKPLNVPNIEETGIFLGKGSPFLEWLVGSIWALPKLLKSSPPLSVKCTNVEKKCSNLEHFFWNPNHPGKPLHPRVYIGKKKVLQTILASLKHLPNIEEEGVYLLKGLGTK